MKRQLVAQGKFKGETIRLYVSRPQFLLYDLREISDSFASPAVIHRIHIEALRELFEASKDEKNKKAYKKIIDLLGKYETVIVWDDLTNNAVDDEEI